MDQIENTLKTLGFTDEGPQHSGWLRAEREVGFVRVYSDDTALVVAEFDATKGLENKTTFQWVNAKNADRVVAFIEAAVAA